jgi:hypothetical protein
LTKTNKQRVQEAARARRDREAPAAERRAAAEAREQTFADGARAWWALVVAEIAQMVKDYNEVYEGAVQGTGLRDRSDRIQLISRANDTSNVLAGIDVARRVVFVAAHHGDGRPPESPPEWQLTVTADGHVTAEGLSSDPGEASWALVGDWFTNLGSGVAS